MDARAGRGRAGLALVEPVPTEHGGAADRRSCSGSSRRPAEPRTPATSGSRCSRSRTSTCRQARSCRTSAGTSAASPRAGSSARRAPSRRSIGAASRRARSHARMPGRAARTPDGSASSSELPEGLGRLRARPRELLARRAGARSQYEDVITYPAVQAGPRVRRRRGRRGRRRWWPLPARRPGRSCARCASSTSTAASRSGGGGSRSRSRRPSSRPSGRSRTRTRPKLRERIVAALGERFGADLRA